MQQTAPPSPQELKRQLAESERRVKELDAREQYLVEREHILDEGPLTITVLDETIKAKKFQLNSLKDKLKDCNLQLVKRRTELLDIDDKLAESKDVFDHLRISNEAETDSHSKIIRELKKEKRDIESEIADRKKYYDKQEKDIAAAVDEGNAVLRGIGYEVRSAQNQRNELLAEVAGIEMQKVNCMYELSELKSKADLEIADIEQSKDAILDSINKEKQYLSEITIQSKLITDETNKKVNMLKVKEQELLTREEAVRKDRVALETERRRWNSTKSLYGIN